MIKTYDMISVGEFATSSRTITQTDIVLYAGLTGDFNPVHMDDEYAKKTPFGERIAHGTITLGLSAPVIGMKLPGEGCVLLNIGCSFRKPVRVGDTITTRAEVTGKDERRRFITLKLDFTNQTGESVATGEALVKPADG